MLSVTSRQLSFSRVALAQPGTAIAALADSIAAVVGNPPTVALVDSPRWPCDLDYSASRLRKRRQPVRGRSLDPILRAIVSYLGALDEFRNIGRLSMFPTPELNYFVRCLGANCKPHLRTFGMELFGMAPGAASAPVPRGGLFTRFMLAGFALYRALERLGIVAFEAYPDLQFRLWSGASVLPSKRYRRAAFRMRQKIVRRLAAKLNIGNADEAQTMDQADAAILALSAHGAQREGVLAVIQEPAEGRFALALSRSAADALIRSGILPAKEPANLASVGRSQAAACDIVRKSAN